MGKTNHKVRFEDVTLRLPKAVVEYVQKIYGNHKKRLEYYVVDWIRIDVEIRSEEGLAELFDLRAAFKAILD